MFPCKSLAPRGNKHCSTRPGVMDALAAAAVPMVLRHVSPIGAKHWRTKVFALEVRISDKWGSNQAKCRPR